MVLVGNLFIYYKKDLNNQQKSLIPPLESFSPVYMPIVQKVYNKIGLNKKDKTHKRRKKVSLK